MKNRQRNCLKIAVVCLVCFLYGLVGQATSVSADELFDIGTESSIYAKMYDGSNGLPTSESNAVVQSSDGFIWIGGYSGLVRYDGNEFYHFDATTGITSVASLYIDTKDRLWIGTNDSGIALYQYGKFTFWGLEDGMTSTTIKSITEDNSGHIIMATTNGLAYIDEEGKLSYVDDGNISDSYIMQVTRDKEGDVYGVTLDGDVFRVRDLEVIGFWAKDEISFGTAISIQTNETEKGIVYLGMENDTVIRMDLESTVVSYDTISVSPQSNINYLLSYGERMWVCADNGIGYFENDQKYVPVEDLPMNNSIDFMTVDSEGNYWFSSSRQGVMKIVKNQFTNMSELAKMKELVVNTTCLFDKNLYIGADDGLYIVDEKNQPVENELTKLLQGVRIRCMMKDSLNQLWICTFSDYGLLCYHTDGSYEVYQEENGLNSNRVRCVIETSDGRIVAAGSGGINIIKNGKVAKGYGEAEGIDNTEVLSLCEAKDGVIYAGSDGGGIYVIDGDKVHNIGQQDGLKSGVIMRIRKDPDTQGYWIVTGNSLAYIEEEQVTTITEFLYSNNFDILFNDEDAWILSSNGIYVVKLDTLRQNQEIEYRFYNQEDGLHCNATANSWSYVDDDCNIYMAGTPFVVRMNMNHMEVGQSEVKLAIPFVEIDDEIIYFEESNRIKIPKDCKRVTVHGFALTYSLNNPKVRYYMEGFSDTEVFTTKAEMEPVSYTNLKGGEYTFYLSVLDNSSGKIKNEISVHLIKEKSLLEKIWFQIILAVVVISVVLAITLVVVRKRMQGYRDKETRLSSFIDQLLAALAKAIDLTDPYSNGHSIRVAHYASAIASSMGYNEEDVKMIYQIALVHDIGKFVIPKEILDKPGELTEEEYAIVKDHARIGYEIFKDVTSCPELALAAGYHHERIDGKGYPGGVEDKDIPRIVKIITVANAFDAMNSVKPYRGRRELSDIVEELKMVAGVQLDAEIVLVLLKLIEESKLDV